jgi:hypothetical protein
MTEAARPITTSSKPSVSVVILRFLPTIFFAASVPCVAVIHVSSLGLGAAVASIGRRRPLYRAAPADGPAGRELLTRTHTLIKARRILRLGAGSGYFVVSEEDGGLGAFAILQRENTGDSCIITEPTSGAW